MLALKNWKTSLILVGEFAVRVKMRPENITYLIVG